jgi:outer membrane protein OmpA-like peptidoglycan-associated protein
VSAGPWRLGALLTLAACHGGPGIRSSADVLKEDLDRARRSNALRCAPAELAQAEANLDFVYGELAQGNASRAFEHLTLAEAASRAALALSRDCAPRQVVVREEPKLVVKIEAADADGDGVADPDDRCPSVAGPEVNQGCPVEVKDRDGDGIPDELDSCPDQPEDRDGFQDEDGCPDVDNDGDGVLDGDDKCPDERGPATNHGCPVRDRDGDGVPDGRDRCPDEPEDKDGFQDEDGCPDLDNDEDGLPDEKDACPDEAGPADNKGCPRKFKLIVVTRARLELRKQLKFATGSPRLVGGESERVLDEVAQALADDRKLKRLRIEGHTDSVGDDAANLRLSQGRANAVLAALVKRKVDPARLEAVGFGETRPLATNGTAAGRAENRRIEFTVLQE